MNKKILAIPFLTLLLAACGGGDGGTNDTGGNGGSGGNNGSDRPIERPFINDPVDVEEGFGLAESNEFIEVGFSLNNPSKKSYKIGSSNTSRDVKSIDIEIDYEESKISKDDLSTYVKNYDLLLNRLSQIGSDILARPNDVHKFSFEIEDLPAHLYQDSKFMDAERLISNALVFKVFVNKGMNLETGKPIRFSYKNDNEIPSLPDDLVLNYEYDENSTNYINFTVSDKNYNDTIEYRIVVPVDERDLINVSSTQCSNDVCTLGDDKLVSLRVDVSNIEEIQENSSFAIYLTDKSATGANFETLNEVPVFFNLLINNNEEHLTPYVIFTQTEYDVSESGGASIPFVLKNSLENPELPLEFNIDIDLDGVEANVAVDRENNRINFSDINISSNISKVLTATVSDGIGNYSTDILINFIEDIDRSPKVMFLEGSSVNINESTGGSVSYVASLNNPNRDLTVDVIYSRIPTTMVYEHNPRTGVIEFSNIELMEDFSGEIRVVATDGIDSAEDVINIEFINDVEPVVEVPSTFTVSEETGGVLTYTGYVTNSTERRFTANHSVIGSVPDGLDITHSAERQEIIFNTEDMSIRGDVTLNIIITASDGVSTIEYPVSVVIVNDVDKEMVLFKESYNEWLDYHSQVTAMNAESVIFDFYKEVALIQGYNPILLEEMGDRVNQFMLEERMAMDVKINEINSFIQNTPINANPSDFDEGNALLSDFVSMVENYGLQALLEINDLASSGITEGLPTLNNLKNSLSPNNVFGRYVGNTTYGRYVEVENINWRFNQGYKMLDLVNPNKICN